MGRSQEADSKGTTDTDGSRDDDPVDEEAARREEWQEAMQQGLLVVHGLEFDKKWIRLLRVIKTQVHTHTLLSVSGARSVKCSVSVGCVGWGRFSLAAVASEELYFLRALGCSSPPLDSRFV